MRRLFMILLMALVPLMALDALELIRLRNNPNAPERPAIMRDRAGNIVYKYYELDQQPSYPGSSEALINDLANNLEYPAVIPEKEGRRRIILTFVILEDGSVDDIEVCKSLSPDCDKAAVRALKKIKRFNPGMKNGKPVSSEDIVPVVFRKDSLKKKATSERIVIGVDPSDGFINDGLKNGMSGGRTIDDMPDDELELSFCYRVSEPSLASPLQCVTDRYPSYPGGKDALLQDVTNNLMFLDETTKNQTEGCVMLQFVVEKDGSIGETRVLESLSPECDKAAIEALKKVKHFEPALVDGRPVRVWNFLPVSFKLTGSKSKDSKE